MTSDDSFYRAPASPLDRPAQGSARSLDDAIEGNYDFDFGEVIREAWDLTSGSKTVILGALLITIGVNAASGIVSGIAEGSESAGLAMLDFVVSIAVMLISYPISAGIFLYSIKRAGGDPTASFDDVLSCFGQFLPVVGLSILQMVLTLLGFLALLIPGIYLAVAYFFGMPLLVERRLGIWESLETSRKAVTTQWFKIAGFAFVVGLGILIGGVVTLGIGLIWLFPFGSLTFGILYREIFGLSEAST